MLEHCDMTPYELAHRAGLSPAHISNALRRESKRMAFEHVRAIAVAAGVSPSWLATGEGSMLSSATSDDAGERHPVRHDDGRQVPPEGVPARLGAFRGYAEAERAAMRQRPDTPPWVWVIVADANPLSIGGAAPSPYVLAKLAEFIEQHASPEAIADATARASRE